MSRYIFYRLLFLITLLLFKPVISLAGCVNNIPEYTKTIQFGNIIVQRDTPVGTPVATAQVEADINFSCEGDQLYDYHEVIYTPLSYYGNNVYDIGVEGYGIRISENSPSGELHHYFPITISGWSGGGSGGAGTNQTNLYKFEIIKTSEKKTSGNIRTGIIAYTSMTSQFYIGKFSIAGGSVTTIGCTVSTPSLTFIFGNIETSDFGTTIGFIPRKYITHYITLSCDAGVNVSATLSATQNPDLSNNSVIALTNQGKSGTASGVGVQLIYNDSALKIGEKIPLIASSGTQEQLPITAQYYQTRSSVSAGTANALATLMLTYQ